ncbi:MAG: amino acid adenylation domain-containing protein [Candidatus Aminicenantes bacterium]|nr:amino acid adenylation domain-containing protein [Candidatus Aminicenantes bacterium]
MITNNEQEKFTKENIENIIALTPLQEGMLFYYLKDTSSIRYFEQLYLTLSGEIELKYFEKAWNLVIETNEILRTVFRWENLENPVQVVLKKHELQWEYSDISSMEPGKIDNRIDMMKKEDRKRSFDFGEVPFRVLLCKVEEKKFAMIISNHHILYDGWSNGIILKEFIRFYNALRGGEKCEKKVKTKFKEYIRWIKNQDSAMQLEFWKEYLSGFEIKPAAANFASIEPGTPENGYFVYRFSGQIVEEISDFVKKRKITPSTLLYTGCGIVLQRYLNSDDIVIGTLESGRKARINGIEDMVGLLINTLPLRVKTTSFHRVNALLQETAQVLIKREKYEWTQLADINRCAGVKGTENLFDFLVAVENYPIDKALASTGATSPESSPGDYLRIESYSQEEQTEYDLTMIIKTFEGIELSISYNKGRFEEEGIRRMAAHFETAVGELMRQYENHVFQLDILTQVERKKILEDFNDTAVEFPADRTIDVLFREHVEKRPDKCAVVFYQDGNKSLPLIQITYRELDERVNRMANLLREKGVIPGMIVSIMVERSIEMIIGIYSIIKVGGAYLPIDPEYPEERIEYLLKDSGAKIMLGRAEERKSRRAEEKKNLEIIFIDSFESSNFRASNPSNLAYIIYTSGSTGKPKGVMVEHCSLANLLNWVQRKYSLGEFDMLIQNTTYVFDVSIFELFWWGVTGASVYLPPVGDEKEPAALVKAIEKQRITHIDFVPSLLMLFLEYLEELPSLKPIKSLRQVVATGEELPVHHVEYFYRVMRGGTGVRLVDLFGPTEATVEVSYFNCAPGENRRRIPIGKPIDNIYLYILGNHSHIQPIGIPGELCISGIGLARGYLNSPELTAEKFILPSVSRNPFEKGFACWDLPKFLFNRHSPLYKTGDLARWLPDGNIEYLGRIDHQVKLRGFRIELGEIENQLLKHNQVKEAVVIIRKDRHHTDERYLCGYIVPGKKLAISDLKAYLAQKLPAYMVPTFFVQMEHLPLTISGKVDRANLPAPERDRALVKETYVEPRSDIEKIIADAWKQVLKIENVGVHDNFFDIGGNSSYIIRLTGKLRHIFKKDIPVVELFNYPTVSAQAKYLGGEEPGGKEKEISPVGEAAQLEIAVIGMAGRFPGARNIDEFWDNLKEGVESITFLTDEELETMGVNPGLIKNHNYVKAKGALENIEYFDPSFFDYSTREAELMDPQLRVMHECVYEALEDAGYDPGIYHGSIGLYAGSFSNSLWMRQLSAEINSHSGLLAIESLNDRDYLSTRISYKLNLKGPAVTIQTACSTSLTAIDAACQSLLCGRCRIALAGGVTITLQDRAGYLHEEGMVRSPDGHCRPFDAHAKGTVGGNGVGVVVLKRLADAIADGDNIRAVIKGSATNNDGSRKVGYTAPSIEGQAEAIRAAQAAAGIDPETITYLETHGTGTVLGDPVEIEALKQAFGTGKKHYCRLGTLKANIGHLDAAAGAAGFIKTVLALEHREIPPVINFETPNPQIDFENSPFYLDTKLRKWENENHPLRAGVSSFGIGGTNVHVVLEEAPQIQPDQGGRDKKLILLSAKTKGALDRATFNLAQYLTKNPGTNISDAAYTLQVGRRAFNQRRMVVGAATAEIIDALSNPAGNPAIFTSTCEDSSKHVIFMFSGQGAQYTGMGLDLYRTEPVFRQELDRCFEILNPLAGYDVKEILYPSDRSDKSDRSDRSDPINRTAIAQPLLFVFEYALAKLLISWGIKPHAMIGHSIGEYTAACLAGVFSLDDALTLVVWRGKLMQEMPGGSMLSVPLPVEELEPLLKSYGNLSLAAVNSSSLCVVSGPDEAVDAFAAMLKENGNASTRLHTSHAFHSQMMDPMLPPFGEKVRTIALNPPNAPYISNATGCWITVEQAVDPQYWIDHVRGAVYFNEGLAELLKDAKAVLVEVGPGRALSTFARKHKDRGDHQPIIHMVRHPGDKIADDYFLLQQIGQLWLSGVTVQWEEFYRREKRRRVPLPTYSFDHRYFWKYGREIQYKNTAAEKEETPPDTVSQEKKDGKPNARKPIDEWFYIPHWKSSPKISFAHPGSGAAGKWIVFIDESDFGQGLVNRLKQGGAEISLVKAGSGFARLADGLYTLNPAKPGDYIDLFKTLTIEDKIPRKVLHLWNTRQEDANHNNIDRVLEKGFYSLVYLAQAVGKQGITGELSVIVISSNMQAVLDNETGSPLHSTLLGACKVIPKEYPNIFVRSIDIVLPEPRGREEQKLLDLLMAEWAGEDKEQEVTLDLAVAYRNNVRWAQFFNPVVLSSPQGLVGRLREKGVYLITGGMGGMGMELAGYLAKNVRARIILTDLSPFPGPDLWNNWSAEHDREDTVARKIQRLRELEALGAEIIVVQADAADYARMKTVISDIIRRFGSLDGVIHAAGLPDGGIIQAKTREAMEAVMAPKIKGTLILDALLSEFRGNRPPDFFVLCSSLTSILGAFGQVAYTAANVFLNSFARYKNSNPAALTLTVSINWDAWEEVGMAAKAEAEFQRVKVEHPLFLDRILKEDGKIIYNSRFSVKTMWLLDEHRIMGKAVLPGTAFLEMARTAFELHTGSAQAIIKEIFFLEPLSVDDNEEREVRTVLEGQGDDLLFSISNRGTGNGSKWILNATGKLAHMVQPVSLETISDSDINELQAAVESPTPNLNSGLMTFGPRFANLRSVKYGKNRGLAVLELDDAFLNDLTSYKLHPALLDRVISILDAKVKDPDDGNYIPFSYRGVKILRPLPRKITSVVSYIESLSAQKETLEFKVRILDEKGDACVEIESFVMKRVNNELPVNWAGQMKDGAVDETREVRLEITEPGNLDSFRFQDTPRVKPGSGEVEIEVYATGLNFKEVLFALGMLPLPPGRQFTFGLECSGRITSCGKEVEEFKIGDEVIAFATSAFSRYVTVPVSSVAWKPERLGFEESAAIPVAFMTAYYSLVTLGRLRKGERILIHSAAGGVGLAAVKIAQWVGAEIFVTAGNPEKREYLASLGLQHVMDSRSTKFADEVMTITGGKGVDVVLNSLSGEAILKGISILAPHGRFLELGVRDIAENTALGMRAFEKSTSFSAVSVDVGAPGFTGIFREMVHHINQQHFEPLPYRVFPLEQVAGAFKYMAQAKHIGKIVVSRPVRLEMVGRGILPAEGMEIFARVLNREESTTGPGLSRVVVSTWDFNSRIRESRKNRFPGDGADAGELKPSTHTGSRNPRPLLSIDYRPPLSDMEKRLVAAWEEYLGLEKVGIHDNFFELGASSLDIIQVNHKLNALLGKELSVVAFYTYPTVHSLAVYLDDEKQSKDALIKEEKNSAELSKSQKTLKNTISKMKGFNNERNR